MQLPWRSVQGNCIKTESRVKSLTVNFVLKATSDLTPWPPLHSNGEGEKGAGGLRR
jgi:hypothetical protein